MQFKLGLIVNPVAGLGGSVALKGSDGEDTAAKAIALGAEPKSNSRTKAALEVLVPHQSNITIYTVNDEMGEQTAKALGFNTQVVYQSNSPTTSDDTEAAARLLQQQILEETVRWPDEALLPLMQYALEQKNLLEEQVANLKMMAKSNRSLKTEQTDLEKMISVSREQLTKAEQIEQALSQPPPSQTKGFQGIAN